MSEPTETALASGKPSRTGATVAGLALCFVAAPLFSLVLALVGYRYGLRWMDEYIAQAPGTLIAAFVGWLFVLVGAVLLPRTRGLPGGLFAVSAALPALTALGASFISDGKVRGAIAGTSIDAAQRARIIAEGVSEMLAAGTLAHLLGTVLLGTLTWLLVIRARVRSGRFAFGAPVWATLGAAVFGALLLIGASIAIEAVRWASPSLHFVALLPLFALPVGAAAASAASHDDPDAARADTDVFAAGLLALTAVLTWIGFSHAELTSTAFGAVGGMSVDPGMKSRILSESRSEAGAAAVASLVGLLPGTLGLAAFTALRLKQLLARIGGVVVETAAVGLFALLVLGAAATRTHIQDGLFDTISATWSSAPTPPTTSPALP